MNFPDWQPERWHHIPQNPIIAPPDPAQRAAARARRLGLAASSAEEELWPGSAGVIGDPQVLLPGEFDDRWHMFCIGHGHFFHYESDDGVAWELAYDYLWRSGPTSLIHDGTQWTVYYSNHKQWPECSDSGISVRTSQDLTEWSDPVDLIGPELDWEREGPVNQVRNPCVLALPDGRYRMYYSGGTVFMADMGFEEPKYVSFAEADNPFGPFVKHWHTCALARRGDVVPRLRRRRHEGLPLR